MVLPAQGEFSYVAAAAEGLEGIFQIFNSFFWSVHGHFCVNQVLRWIVGKTTLAGLLVDDEHPVIRVGDIDPETVRAHGQTNGRVAYVEIGIGFQNGGRIGSGAPYGIGFVVADEAIF